MGYIYPVNKPRITSKYGIRTIKSLGIVNQMHYGIDLVSDKKDLTIFASDGGQVVEVAKGESYGKYIKIMHLVNGVKWYTIYAHLASQSVKEGQTVKQGQVIGIMGATGRVTGVHLHFEIRKGSQKVDPQTLLVEKTPENLVGEYMGGSIVDYLKHHKRPSDFITRRKLAEQHNIMNYTGNAEQNSKLLKLLRGF